MKIFQIKFHAQLSYNTVKLHKLKFINYIDCFIIVFIFLQQFNGLSVPILQHPDLQDVLLIPVIGPRFVTVSFSNYSLLSKSLPQVPFYCLVIILSFSIISNYIYA